MFGLRSRLLLLSLLLATPCFAGQKVTGNLQVTSQVSCPFVLTDSSGNQSCGTTLPLANGGSNCSEALSVVSTNGTINNLSPSTCKIKFTGTNVTLTGIAAPSGSEARSIVLFNNTGNNLSISYNSSGSSVGNRMFPTGSTTYSLPNLSSAEVFYGTVGASSGWVFKQEGARAGSGLAKSSAGEWSCNAASAYAYGCLSSSNFTTYLDNWQQRDDDIYATNSGNAWIGIRECSELSTYGTCSAQIECTVNNSGDCNTANGTNESTCTALGGASQCIWSDPNCDGSYFTSCSGTYHGEDGSTAKVQINPEEVCGGTATACSGLTGEDCDNQDGCGPYVSNTCSEQGSEEDCNNAGCTYSSSSCTGDNGSPNTCSSYDGDEYGCEGQEASGCSRNYVDCGDYYDNQEACESDGHCSWSGPDCYNGYHFHSCGGDNSTPSTCGDYSSDEMGCTGAGCTYNAGGCSGDNSSCPGTATACSSLSVAACLDQDGCSLSAQPGLSINGSGIAEELKVTGVTGSGKVVCVKSDGYFGTCSGSYSSGSCTCS